jgi:hypothetical protein
MDTLFPPSRRNGYIFHGVLLFVLGGGGALTFLASMRQQIGSDLIFYMILSVLLLLPVPWIGYRFYALSQAVYVLERDGLRIRWGLRGEDIPLPQIEWIRPANELGFALRLPWKAAPGAFLGVTRVEGLGVVDFIASDLRNMLLVATPNKVYAISPADPKAFMRAFRRIIELGSLSPLPLYSIRPSAFLEQVWNDRLARGLLLTGLGLTVLLFIGVVLRIPSLPQVSLGFDAERNPLPPGPSESLLLLVVLGAGSYVLDLLAGLFFYRLDESRPVAYLLWIASVVAPLLLLAGAWMAQ